MFDFSGKTAVVTGASRGIGEAIVRQLDAGGARVALVARSADKLEAIAAELTNDPLVLATDLSDPASVEQISTAVLDAFGGLDILVNNAAVERNEPAHRATAEAIDETLFVNLRQPFLLSSAFAKSLFASQGAIVNISSIASTGAGGTQGAYAASKGGLNTLTKNLANEWANKGVRVNGVAPGLVDTEMWESTFERLGEDAVRSTFTKGVPMQRWGTADEIADVACFLASDKASYVTGQTIKVDGGRTNL
ncbi:SDR family NAD(P)-dependent oxidoreductase [Ilumatobacter coccineus]|uniref:3-oxoacyl-[acyl-carrier-protein] reductase n=1 Tax=Ilumatobacter coccineus (strain NBRC 103263 / KCTC 29153 / YM16-304) TaxID=1313172 RepID=A0A6C7E4P3_ILUCY|nr:SDR family NAD(P)-dependent oxidoreductase [Ilumatobacter coccineus]BAN01162.1 3-oxoacyl-[acyl-carrier-protein] reductase [Ilumatobacter coccineus YM16-304]